MPHATHAQAATPTRSTRPASATRGAPLVASFARGMVVFAVILSLYFAGSRLVLARLHVGSQAPGFPLEYAMDAALFLVLGCVWLGMRGEESRLARELRTARSGTPEARGLALRQRQRMPLLARLCGTRLGAAAVLLADGDLEGARAELRANPLFARGGRLDWLREVVEADEARAGSTSGGVNRCLERLRGLPPSGSREADLYKLHVLVKAVLQKGDAQLARQVCAELESYSDEEARLYSAWLVVWFETDDEPGAPCLPCEAVAAESSEFDEGQLRMAALLARAQGAEKLVERLERRIEKSAGPGAAAIAEPGARE